MYQFRPIFHEGLRFIFESARQADTSQDQAEDSESAAVDPATDDESEYRENYRRWFILAEHGPEMGNEEHDREGSPGIASATVSTAGQSLVTAELVMDPNYDSWRHQLVDIG